MNDPKSAEAMKDVLLLAKIEDGRVMFAISPESEHVDPMETNYHLRDKPYTNKNDRKGIAHSVALSEEDMSLLKAAGESNQRHFADYGVPHADYSDDYGAPDGGIVYDDNGNERTYMMFRADIVKASDGHGFMPDLKTARPETEKSIRSVKDSTTYSDDGGYTWYEHRLDFASKELASEHKKQLAEQQKHASAGVNRRLPDVGDMMNDSDLEKNGLNFGE